LRLNFSVSINFPGSKKALIYLVQFSNIVPDSQSHVWSIGTIFVPNDARKRTPGVKVYLDPMTRPMMMREQNNPEIVVLVRSEVVDHNAPV
jgi:hypothetical protein